MNIIILILVLIAGIILGSIFSIHKNKNKRLVSGQVETKRENKDKILEFLKNNQRIENKDIQELLKVSDSTAVRYLDELEEENKIKQIGKTGNAVYYQLK